MSTRQHPGLPLAAAKRNRSTEDQSIVNTNRPTKWRRANAGRDLPKKRARGTRRIGRESTRSPWSERHGGWTRAATDLYPHQWSWDSGFIAIGLAHLDTGRAARELLTLFRHQWKPGKVPHIVFNPEAPPDSYFPGAEHWACAAASPEAPPAPPYTSCLCQPPTHAIAAQRVWEAATNGRARAEATAFLRDIYPKLLSWHRYLLTARDPEESGLVTIYHPWESGTDNSPRWDAALAAVEVGDLPPYTRYDLQHVTDPSHRPTDEEYDRYLWLLELLKRARYDEADIYESHPFLVKDVLFSAILVAANDALLEISRVVGAPEEDRETIES